jgi:hypothetical protein
MRCKMCWEASFDTSGMVAVRSVTLPLVEAKLNQLPRFIVSSGVLPLRNRVLRGFDQHWISAYRLDQFDRTIGSDCGPELYHTRNMCSLGEIRIDRGHLAHDITCLLGSVRILSECRASRYWQQRHEKENC